MINRHNTTLSLRGWWLAGKSSRECLGKLCLWCTAQWRYRVVGVGFTQVRGHSSLPMGFQLFDKAPKQKGNSLTTHLKCLANFNSKRCFLIAYVRTAFLRADHLLLLFHLNWGLNEQVLLAYTCSLWSYPTPSKKNTKQQKDALQLHAWQLFVLHITRELATWLQYETSQ